MNLTEIHNFFKSVVINVDQIHLKYVACGNTTLSQKSSTTVLFEGVSGKQMITRTFTMSFDGQLMDDPSSIGASLCPLLVLSSYILLMLHYLYVALFSVMHSFHLSIFQCKLFSCSTLFMLHSVHVEFFSCCPPLVLHFLHVAPFLCCTFSVSQLFDFSLYLSLFMFSHLARFSSCTFFRIVLFSCCTLFHIEMFSHCTLLVLHFVHVAPFLCCTFFVSHLSCFSLFLSLFIFSMCCTFFMFHLF